MTRFLNEDDTDLIADDPSRIEFVSFENIIRDSYNSCNPDKNSRNSC